MNKSVYTPRYVIELAQKLRKHMTATEKVLWERLNKQQMGVKFRRQHPIGRYILDFYCFEKRICIEIDGAYHASNKLYDMARDEYLKNLGIDTYRFATDEIEKNIDFVIQRIKKLLSK